MKKTNKGFTIVELVVVIAVVAVLAAVLIPTFTSIIKKANDSAYLQERQNQRIEDLAEKIDNQNYLTWDDFEGKIAEAIAAATPTTGDHLTAEEVKTAIQSAIDEYSAAQANTRLTEDQVKKIVEKSLEGQVTMEQITALVNKAAAANPGVNVATVQSIVNQAIAGMSANPGLSAAQVSAMITSALQGQAASTEKTVAEAVAAALAQYAANNPSLTAEQVATIVEEALAAQTPAGDAAVEITSWNELVNFATSADTRSGKIMNTIEFAEFPLSFSGTKTLDLAGHTLTLANGAFDATNDSLTAGALVYVEKNASLTLNDSSNNNSGSIEFLHDNAPVDGNDYSDGTFIINNKGNLTINGGSYTGARVSAGSEEGVTIYATFPTILNYGVLTINGGTYTRQFADDVELFPGFSFPGINIFRYGIIMNGYSDGSDFNFITQEESGNSPLLTINGGTFDNQVSDGKIVYNIVHSALLKGAGVVKGTNDSDYDSSKIATKTPAEYAKIGEYTIDPQKYVIGYTEEQEYTAENNYTIYINSQDGSSGFPWDYTMKVVKDGGTYTLSYHETRSGAYGFDPTPYVPATGYTVTENNGTWTVTAN